MTTTEITHAGRLTNGTVFLDELVIGQHIRMEFYGKSGRHTWSGTKSGTYIGVALDEEEGLPYHYFVNGEINGLAQASFGFAATKGTPTTTDKTPTALIESWGV